MASNFYWLECNRVLLWLRSVRSQDSLLGVTEHPIFAGLNRWRARRKSGPDSDEDVIISQTGRVSRSVFMWTYVGIVGTARPYSVPNTGVDMLRAEIHEFYSITRLPATIFNLRQPWHWWPDLIISVSDHASALGGAVGCHYTRVVDPGLLPERFEYYSAATTRFAI